MRESLSHGLFILALGLTLGVAGWRAQPPPPPRFAPTEYQPPPAAPAPPRFERTLIPRFPATPSVHSGTLVELAGGGLLAAWFGGSREGSADVAIQGARWDPAGGWGPAFVISDRPNLEQALGRALRKLGNPVLGRDPEGRLWLFLVTSAPGGWSTSALAHLTSRDQGQTWDPPRRLVTSPFLNLSTLVRTRPLAYQDGGLALPIYHELAGKFSELLRLDRDGRVLGKHRISSGRGGIQPSLVATGPDQVRAFLRRTGGSPDRVLTSQSQDAGVRWSDLTPTELPNPDAGVAALARDGGGYLLVYNDSPEHRGRLALADSPDGLSWRRLAVLENGNPADEFSYPFLIRTQAGDYHLIYTWQRTRMAHIRFNLAGLP